MQIASLSLPPTDENFILPTRFPSLLGGNRIQTELQKLRISTGLCWKGLELLGEGRIQRGEEGINEQLCELDLRQSLGVYKRGKRDWGLRVRVMKEEDRPLDFNNGISL